MANIEKLGRLLESRNVLHDGYKCLHNSVVTYMTVNWETLTLLAGIKQILTRYV